MALKITQGASPETKVTLTFKELSKTASSLNQATDRLNLAIQHLNDALKELNLGVSSWRTFSTWEDGPFSTEEQLGYDKWAGKWGIALRKIFEDKSSPNDQPEDVTTWTFAEAPREMRIRAISHLHELLAKLNEDAEKTTKSIIIKTIEAEQLAKAIYQLGDDEAEKTMGAPSPTGDK